MRLLITCLVLVLALFQYDFWFGKNGYLDYRKTQLKIAENKAENESLSQRNQIISAEIKGLTESFDAIEEHARMQLDMVKPKEVFYRVIPEYKLNNE